MKDNLKLETVATTMYAAQAEVIRSILESGGFEAYVTDANAGIFVGLTNSVKVQVESSQADAARAFLASSESEATPADQE